MALSLPDRAAHAVRWWLLHNLPTCRAAVRLMSESLERPLTLRERLLLRLHLWVCLWCVWYLEQLQLLRESVRARAGAVLEDDSSPVRLSVAARERIGRALRDREVPPFSI